VSYSDALSTDSGVFIVQFIHSAIFHTLLEMIMNTGELMELFFLTSIHI